jgi:hypothetical protein
MSSQTVSHAGCERQIKRLERELAQLLAASEHVIRIFDKDPAYDAGTFGRSALDNLKLAIGRAGGKS